MSLHARLNTVIAGLLLLSLTALIALLLVQSTPRIVAETQGMMRFAEAFARRSLENVAQSPVGKAELESLLAQLYALRHVTVRLEPDEEPRKGRMSHEGIEGWLMRRLQAGDQTGTARLPVMTRAGSLGTLVIAASPRDEIAELLDEILQISVVGGLICLVLFAVTTRIVNRSLRPIGDMRRALSDLEEGRFAISIEPGGPPELRRLASEINSLASSLELVRSENARLSEILVRLQDDERRDIARALHDEFGPHLFAARTRLAMLKSALASEPPDTSAALAAADRLGHEINDIQGTNRRVLNKLEPAGLKELGLAAALEDMVNRWRQEQPHIDLKLTLSEPLSELEPTYALTIYRVVQEGLTNAFRHAAATQITVEVRRCAPASTARGPMTSAIEIEVRDDGIGLADDHTSGFGLNAMRQRVVALGGTCRVANIPGGGVSLNVVLFGITGVSGGTYACKTEQVTV